MEEPDIAGTMDVSRDLEHLNLTVLAVLCQQVADDPSVAAATAERAWQLKREWVLLQQPPNPNLSEQRQIEHKQAELKARMAAFLTPFFGGGM